MRGKTRTQLLEMAKNFTSLARHQAHAEILQDAIHVHLKVYDSTGNTFDHIVRPRHALFTRIQEAVIAQVEEALAKEASQIKEALK